MSVRGTMRDLTALEKALTLRAQHYTILNPENQPEYCTHVSRQVMLKNCLKLYQKHPEMKLGNYLNLLISLSLFQALLQTF